MNSRILLTGASGLLGSALLEILSCNHEIIAVYQTTPIDVKNQNITPLKLDLNNSVEVTKLFSNYEFELIINCAGASDVDRCELDHKYAERGNVEIVKNLIDNMDLSIPLIHFSSDYIFSGKKAMPSEDEAPEPINHYGKTKLLAEKLLAENDINYKIIRICSLFSLNKNARKNLATSIIKALEDGKRYYAVSDLISNHTDVDKLAEVVSKLIYNPDLPKILHLAESDSISRYHFALKLAKKLQRPSELIIKSNLVEINLPAERPKLAGLSSKYTAKLPDINFKKFN